MCDDISSPLSLLMVLAVTLVVGTFERRVVGVTILFGDFGLDCPNGSICLRHGI